MRGMIVLVIMNVLAWGVMTIGCANPKNESARVDAPGVPREGRTGPMDEAPDPPVVTPPVVTPDPTPPVVTPDPTPPAIEPTTPPLAAPGPRPDPEPNPGPFMPVDAAGAAELAQLAASGRLGYDLYRRLAAKPGNVVISPAGLGVALAMALGGAKGDTAAELARALAVPEAAPEQAHRRFGTALRAWNATSSVKLAVAARVFVEKTAPIEAGFLALTRDRYLAPSLALSFVDDAEGARGTINRWFGARTDGRIPELLPAGSLTRLTRLVLASAVAFKGTWKARFDPARTSPGIFTTAGGDVFEVPMMRMNARLSWVWLPDGTRLLELPYAGGELRMVLLLPASTDALEALEGVLAVPTLSRWRALLKSVDVTVALPRFRLEPASLRLKDDLVALGVRRAFQENADFTGMARLPDGLFLSEVHHRATLEVNEEGAEAAAGTAAVMATMSADLRPGPEPPSFIADRPFLFVLLDTRTGLPLFLGRVANPAPAGARAITPPANPSRPGRPRPEEVW